jgi:hypothetical protein
MKLKIAMIFLGAIFIFSCAGQNDTVIQAIKDNSFSGMEGTRLTISGVKFDDWAYPDLEKMQELFPENKEFWELSYKYQKYHGVKIVLEDLENVTYEYDETDDSYMYDEPDKYKMIAFFPMENMRLVRKFKDLYVTGGEFRLSGKFLFVLPGSVWTEVQIQENDMPVLIIQSVF